MQITIHSKGIQQGPFPAEQVKQLLQSRKISPTDLGWAPGMAEWKPLSTFVELQGGVTPPTMSSFKSSASVSSATSRTEPLAIWSLVLGIVSLVGCSVGGFLVGIPAVICGHLGRSKIRKDSQLSGAGLALAGLITGYLGIATLPLLAAIALPAITGALERGKATQTLNNMKMIHLAVQQAQLDGTTMGSSELGFPATAKLKSKADLKAMLVSNEYLTADDLDHLGFEEISVANVSDEDPGDTLFLRATSPSGKTVIVFRKGGDGAIYRTGQNVYAPDPPRTPAFLD